MKYHKSGFLPLPAFLKNKKMKNKSTKLYPLLNVCNKNLEILVNAAYSTTGLPGHQNHVTTLQLPCLKFANSCSSTLNILTRIYGITLSRLFCCATSRNPVLPCEQQTVPWRLTLLDFHLEINRHNFHVLYTQSI